MALDLQLNGARQLTALDYTSMGFAMKAITSMLSAVLIASALPGYASEPKADHRQLDEKQVNKLAEAGASKFGILWSGHLSGARERGVMAVTDGVTTLTTRAGSRTYIVHNTKEFPPSENNEFKGSDEELKQIGMKFLLASGARKEEIADMQILQQFTQVGEMMPDSKRVHVQQPAKSHRTLLIHRRVAGIDAVSSRLVLNADSAGRIAFMELSWPDISSDVLKHASKLRALVARRYKAPPLAGAEVEAVQPVLLNSPAVGFYNDTTAAIRVIYRPTSRQVGQKAVRYLNERGEDVALPRDVDPPREERVKRSGPKY
jgi:hypothetical protein